MAYRKTDSEEVVVAKRTLDDQTTKDTLANIRRRHEKQNAGLRSIRATESPGPVRLGHRRMLRQANPGGIESARGGGTG
jgi:hypothetical protein